MKTLNDFELAAVCGGDRWGAENSDGSVSEEEESYYKSGSTSYSTFNSSTYQTPKVSCTEETNVTSEENYTTTTTSPGCTLNSTFPYLSCSLGTPTTTTTRTGGVKRVITCK